MAWILIRGGRVSRQIAEKDWFEYSDRDRVSVVNAMLFDAVHESGLLR